MEYKYQPKGAFMANLQTLKFNRDTLEVIVGDGKYVVVKAFCQNIGLDYGKQHRKLKSDPTFEAKLLKVQTPGGVQDVFCIPLDKLNGWLFTINPNKTKPEVREKLILYKKECFRVLYEHFNKSTTPPAGCPAERFDSRINGYKSQIAQKNKKIEDLRWELVAAQTRLEELESRKIAGGDWIMMEYNLLDLAGALSRHKEELEAYGRQLEQIAKAHRERMQFVDHLLKNLIKHHPKTKNVAEHASKHAKKRLR